MLCRRVVEADSRHAAAWHHLGLSCLAQEKIEDAAAAFQTALGLWPDNIDALTQLGIVLSKQDRLGEALARLRRAIELKPENARAQNALGVVLRRMGRIEEGTICYRQAIGMQRDFAEAHFNLAIALAERKQNPEAVASYECALQARPDYADAFFGLGMLLVQERRLGEAVVCLEQAARLKPDNPETYNNLTMALADMGRFEDALARCDAALKLRPLDAKALMNRGNILTALGRVEEALACYDLAVGLEADYANAHWNRSLAWLTIGDFERGWAEYEWRWRRAETKGRHLAEPRWDGSPLAGKTILLWCEQGLGDTIQFVRYASLLKAQGGTVWLECPAKMMALLSTCPGIERVLAEGTTTPGFDCHAPLMSLPFLCGTTQASIPANIPYLSAEPGQVERWRREFSTSANLRIGVAWQGNRGHRFDQHRSFGAHWFRSLTDLEGIELFSLQKGPGIEQLKTAGLSIPDLGSHLDESGGAFQETAAVMKALDLVITCDSALAHLAGALGVRVWVPLSTPADWRWLHDVEDSLWYPSMRLFRQPALGKWAPVFDRVCEEVVKMREVIFPTIRLEVAPGELLDKLTILQIKSERMCDPKKLRNVRAELAAVEKTRHETIREQAGLSELVQELKETNEHLWDIENEIRTCEIKQDFGAEFIRLARSVYQTNDRRGHIKRQINEHMGARFLEEKEYHGESSRSE